MRLDRDVFVSVFEANIRVLGGLLSAHQLAADPQLRIYDTALHCPTVGNLNAEGADARCAEAMCGTAADCALEMGLANASCPCLLRYDGQLLAMATELGTRLLPAFDTPTGLPVHRLNLATGLQDPSSRHTCTAAAGTYLLEFGLLSRLTGDAMYEAVARRATAALWSRRSALQLVGSGCVRAPVVLCMRGTGVATFLCPFAACSINTHDGTWTAGHTGIGAGVDSFLEYLLKGGLLLDDDSLVRAHAETADAIAEHMLLGRADVHLEVSTSEVRSMNFTHMLLEQRIHPSPHCRDAVSPALP